MFDGVRLNSPFFGGYDWSLPLTAGLDRVEVVRGPFSALYGGDAVGGVVQLVPDRMGGNKLRALIEGGGDGWRRGEVEAGIAGASWDAYVSAASRVGDGALNDAFGRAPGYRLQDDLGQPAGSGYSFAGPPGIPRSRSPERSSRRSASPGQRRTSLLCRRAGGWGKEARWRSPSRGSSEACSSAIPTTHPVS
jgi:outer membrane receptor protein involved in Fe transport